jgi:hypothetical protein
MPEKARKRTVKEMSRAELIEHSRELHEKCRQIAERLLELQCNLQEDKAKREDRRKRRG